VIGAAAWQTLPGSQAAVRLQREDVVVASVRRGPLKKDIRSTGTLVPADLRWLESRVDGRVERILLDAGQPVGADTLIMELSNPTLSRNVEAARIDLDVLEAETIVLEKRLTRDRLAQQAVVAAVNADYEKALFRLNANRELATQSAVSRIQLNESRLLEQQFRAQLGIEQERLEHLSELNAAEIQANAARINRARAQLRLEEALLDSLQVRAGINGVLQAVPLEVGQQIGVGALLARVAREDSLLAELRVQESQAQEVSIGQPATISANGQFAPGVVTRIDPAVANGVVIVDVRFTGAMLPGARPDLRVEGSIEVASIDATLLLSRPVFSRENAVADVFRLASDGVASRVPVRYGVGSIEFIQVLEGLHEGDAVVVSDLSAYAERDTLVIAQ
jgi:HlyD family secretion protein